MIVIDSKYDYLIGEIIIFANKYYDEIRNLYNSEAIQIITSINAMDVGRQNSKNEESISISAISVDNIIKIVEDAIENDNSIDKEALKQFKYYLDEKNNQ